ncbi:hypothetical protein [Crateriforma conspicua]|uniref:Uncharacterized protein n=1 Tax=Crateriforma conspicua TaxID=2527996 RepID=A0A5C5YB54_9PLAN|nr:hypothetical protein [Crateriforma conspicua]QDV61676.1 hypothetical protein Mal65_08030 [Crateriforma conspicua]TWT72073.1 hypothetical protein Pan14r_43900 [Crateriforma conspicua]
MTASNPHGNNGTTAAAQTTEHVSAENLGQWGELRASMLTVDATELSQWIDDDLSQMEAELIRFSSPKSRDGKTSRR